MKVRELLDACDKQNMPAMIADLEVENLRLRLAIETAALHLQGVIGVDREEWTRIMAARDVLIRATVRHPAAPDREGSK